MAACTSLVLEYHVAIEIYLYKIVCTPYLLVFILGIPIFITRWGIFTLSSPNVSRAQDNRVIPCCIVCLPSPGGSPSVKVFLWDQILIEVRGVFLYIFGVDLSYSTPQSLIWYGESLSASQYMISEIMKRMLTNKEDIVNVISTIM